VSGLAASGDVFAEALRGARVVVVGLGASGRAAAHLAKGLGATVVGTDAAKRETIAAAASELEGAGIDLALGGHDAAGLDRADLVVVSPGVPRFAALDAAAARGAPVIGEIELATRLLPVPVIAITGSNGKSTTTTLVGDLLRAAGKRPFVGGNLGDPPAAIVPRPGGPSSLQHDVLVLEISSFQAERIPLFRARAAGLLNLTPNHLDRYDDYQAYCDAKGNLFANQRGDDVTVIPANDPDCERQASRSAGRVVRFGEVDKGVLVGFDRERIVDGLGDATYDRSIIRLAGDHNALNVCAALALVSPFGVAPDVVRGVLADFRGLPHRLAFVREVDGVRHYDDSKGTSVGAAVAAIRGLHEHKIVLIAGGRDKMGSYAPLAEALRERGRGAVLIGEGAARLDAELAGACPLVRAGSMEEAVRAAQALGIAGDAVLLSPCCSSFDMFRDYKHRGDAYVEAVNALTGGVS
jgi:UDP-N-acetylmuramoylalanine--D-glutamate ligase